MQSPQVQLAQIVSSTVSQALSQCVQLTGSNPPLAAAASTAAVQEVHFPTKFEILAFEGESAVSWMTLSLRVVYQARACGFVAELTAAEGEVPRIEVDIFYGSNADPVRLRNIHLAWMALIDNWRGMAIEIVQHSKARNNAWRNFESHLR